MLRKTLIGLICLAVIAGTTVTMYAGAGDARLPEAAMNADMQTVRTLLKQKVDVNAALGDGMTALHWAAFRDDMEMAQLLVQAGADVRAATRIGAMTPLFM